MNAGPRRAAAFALVLAGVGAAAGRAQPAPRFDLVVAGCPPEDEARLRELVAIEIATVGAEAPPRRTAVRVTCAGDSVAVALEDGAPAHAAAAELHLGGSGDATRLRLLALTITELVATSWGEARPSAAPPPPSRPAVVLAAAPPAAPARSPGLRLYAGTSMRRMGAPGTWLAGVTAGAEQRLGGALAAALSLGVEGGDTQTDVAVIGWRALIMTAGVAIQGGRGRLSWSATPGVAAGLTRLSATPRAPELRGGGLDALWVGPMLAGRLRWAVGSRAFAQLELAGGLATRRIVALMNSDTPLLLVQGPWSSAGLGGGVAF